MTLRAEDRRSVTSGTRSGEVCIWTRRQTTGPALHVCLQGRPGVVSGLMTGAPRDEDGKERWNAIVRQVGGPCAIGFA
jgi:hypothetical protein